MKHQTQPTKKSCGQTCVAMLLGVPATDVIASISDKRGTRAPQLAKYLNARGYRIPKRMKNYRGTLGRRAIALVKWKDKRRGGHWVLWAQGRFWDPAGSHEDFTVHGGTIVAYLPVEGP